MSRHDTTYWQYQKDYLARCAQTPMTEKRLVELRQAATLAVAREELHSIAMMELVQEVERLRDELAQHWLALQLVMTPHPED